MSDGMSALLVGTILAVAALAFVLYPLFFNVAERSRGSAQSNAAADDNAILALREIEFDRATGKLSDTDYAELKKTYSERALRELRASRGNSELPASHPERSERVPAQAGAAGVGQPVDAIDAKVREYRLTHNACPACGVRPEPDAVYCSTCGGFLERACPRCRADIREPGAAFCSSCGATLAQLARS